jgi:outer membrane protein TolC
MLKTTTICLFALFVGPLSARADDAVQSLLKERLKVLQEIAELRTTAFEAGQVGMTAVLAAQREVTLAKIELAAALAERVAAREELVAIAKRMEETTAARYEASVASRVEVLEAKAFRLRAEADLAREKLMQR